VAGKQDRPSGRRRRAAAPANFPARLAGSDGQRRQEPPPGRFVDDRQGTGRAPRQAQDPAAAPGRVTVRAADGAEQGQVGLGSSVLQPLRRALAAAGRRPRTPSACPGRTARRRSGLRKQVEVLEQRRKRGPSAVTCRTPRSCACANQLGNRGTAGGQQQVEGVTPSGHGQEGRYMGQVTSRFRKCPVGRAGPTLSVSFAALGRARLPPSTPPARRGSLTLPSRRAPTHRLRRPRLRMRPLERFRGQPPPGPSAAPGQCGTMPVVW